MQKTSSDPKFLRLEAGSAVDDELAKLKGKQARWRKQITLSQTWIQQGWSGFARASFGFIDVGLFGRNHERVD